MSSKSAISAYKIQFKFYSPFADKGDMMSNPVSEAPMRRPLLDRFDIVCIIGLVIFWACQGCGNYELPPPATVTQASATGTDTATSTAESTGTGTATAVAPTAATNTPPTVVVNINNSQSNTQNQARDASGNVVQPYCVCDSSTRYCYSGQANVVCPQILQPAAP